MTAHDFLSQWENFYVIVGSSAAALTGLQFVVIALVSESESMRHEGGTAEIAAFGTPTVVHFCAVLLTGAILSAPWPGLFSVAFAIESCGLLGVLYCLVVIRRTTGDIKYRPVLEDWIWHVVLPLIAYVAILIAGATLVRHPQTSFFAIGGSALLLLFIGIHNAWDTVTYVVSAGMKSPPTK